MRYRRCKHLHTLARGSNTANQKYKAMNTEKAADEMRVTIPSLATPELIGTTVSFGSVLEFVPGDTSGAPVGSGSGSASGSDSGSGSGSALLSGVLPTQYFLPFLSIQEH